MAANRFVLIIYGSLCSGKTTTVDLLVQSQPGLMRVARDTFKRFISDYGQTHNYDELVDQIELGLITSALEHGLSVVVEGNMKIQSSLRTTYERLAALHEVSFLEINLEAPLEILRERFAQRVADAEQAGKKLFCTTEERMMFHYNKYLEYKNPAITTFNTRNHSVQELCELLKNKILA